jgi:hypothetical protein
VVRILYHQKSPLSNFVFTSDFLSSVQCSLLSSSASEQVIMAYSSACFCVLCPVDGFPYKTVVMHKLGERDKEQRLNFAAWVRRVERLCALTRLVSVLVGILNRRNVQFFFC